MNLILLKALVALAPACMLFIGGVAWFHRRKTMYSLLQLVGAGCLVLVVLAHVSEALEHSAGHYFDLSSAILGFALFPTGYLLHSLTKREA
jgi:hypothetical protein